MKMDGKMAMEIPPASHKVDLSLLSRKFFVSYLGY